MSRPTLAPGQKLFMVCILSYEMAIEGSPMKATFDWEKTGQVGCMPVYVDEARARVDYPEAEIMEIRVPALQGDMTL